MMFRARALACSLFLFVCVADETSAQDVQGCNNLNQTEGAKIVVGRVQYKSPQGESEELTETRNFSLQFEMQSRLSNLFDDLDGPSPVLCPAHDPEIDGSTFTENYVQALDAREVLMEVWGVLRGEMEDGEERVGADLCLMVFPVRLHPLEGVDPAPFFHLLRFPAEKREDLDDALLATTFGPEFEIYALLAHSVKRFRNGLWDDAQGLLSRAQLLFENAQENGSMAQTLTQDEDVLGYMAQLGTAITEGASNDPDYDGDLIHVDNALAGGAP